MKANGDRLRAVVASPGPRPADPGLLGFLQNAELLLRDEATTISWTRTWGLPLGCGGECSELSPVGWEALTYFTAPLSGFAEAALH